MKFKIKIKKNLEEMSSMTGGAIQGYGAPFGDSEGNESFNKKQEKDQRLKGHKLVEMYSTQGTSGKNKQQLIDGDIEHDRYLERSKAQGLKNVMESDEDSTLDLGTKDDPALANTEISPLSSARQQTPAKALKAVRDAGYELVSPLGGGQFGKVFKVKSKSDQKEYALKIVMSTPYANQREVRNYQTIQTARQQSPLLAKHFPETFATWQQDGFGFIVMEVLEPVRYGEESMVPDRTYVASTENPLDVWDPALDTDPEGRKQYRDQSLKAAYWYDNVFLPSLRGSSTEIENHALSRLQNVQAVDTDELLMQVSPAALSGLKAQYDRGQEGFQDQHDLHLDFFLSNESNFPNTHRLLRIVAAETANAPYAPVALAKIGNIILNIRAAAIQQSGGQINNIDLDNTIFKFLLKYVKEYRQTSTMRLGYDLKGQKVEQDSLKSTWDAVAKELFDVAGLAARDVHYGNILQRPSGDLVIVDVGLFRKKGEKFRMFEGKKYHLKIRKTL